MYSIVIEYAKSEKETHILGDKEMLQENDNKNEIEVMRELIVKHPKEANNFLTRKKLSFRGKKFNLVDVSKALTYIDGFKDAIGKRGRKDNQLVKALRSLRLVEGGSTPIFVVEEGVLPRHRGGNGKNIKFELFVPDSRVPNCYELAKTLAAAPHLLNGKFLSRYFSYGGFAANPSLVIDSMQILMGNGLIDQDDFDAVFQNVYPFRKSEWVEDESYRNDCMEGFMAFSDKRVPGSPKKGQRTEQDFDAWFATKPQTLFVMKWEGDVRSNGKTFGVNFSVEKSPLKPDEDGRTRYHVGNKSLGDEPMRSQFMRLPKWSNKPIKHKRGKRSNVRPYAFAKMGAALRKRLSEGPATEQDLHKSLSDKYGSDVLELLKSGETITY
jgi:hypothetical protein